MRKKLIMLGAAGLFSILAIPAAPAFAGGGGYCGSSATGCASSSGATICSGAGAFGALDGANNPSDPSFGSNDGKIGANGPATGAANSNLCGSPQN